MVYTGLNLEDFAFQEQVTANDKLQLLSVGRPHWKKGYDKAIKALALLKAKGNSLPLPNYWRITG